MSSLFVLPVQVAAPAAAAMVAAAAAAERSASTPTGVKIRGASKPNGIQAVALELEVKEAREPLVRASP